MKLNNPFLVRGYHSSEYFCDRKKETAQIVSALENERDVTLIAPRRYGKTGLIHNVFSSLPKEYHTIYIDIFSTNSLADFTKMFASRVVGALDTKFDKAMGYVTKVFTSCRPTVTPQIDGSVKFSFDLAPQQAEATLREAFEYLKLRDKRVVIAIDEFQQILEYPEKGSEALLRSLIQFLPNVRFIFAGSRHHLMRDMFMMPRHPFYQSTDILGLDVIPCKEYAVFARKFFNGAARPFEDEVFEELYKRYGGVTWYIQMVLNRVWEMGEGLDEVARIEEAVAHITDLRTFEYADLLSTQSEAEQKLLKAIAKAKVVKEPQSAEFVQKVGIAASTVRSALQNLVARDLVYKDTAGYIVYDRFFGDWLERAGGIDDVKGNVV